MVSRARSRKRRRGDRRGPREPDGGRDGLRSRVLFDGATDIDDVVGDNAEADPAVHSDVALLAAAIEASSSGSLQTKRADH